jgi:hypothetical protein
MDLRANRNQPPSIKTPYPGNVTSVPLPRAPGIRSSPQAKSGFRQKGIGVDKEGAYAEVRVLPLPMMGVCPRQ